MEVSLRGDGERGEGSESLQVVCEGEFVMEFEGTC